MPPWGSLPMEGRSFCDEQGVRLAEDVDVTRDRNLRDVESWRRKEVERKRQVNSRTVFCAKPLA